MFALSSKQKTSTVVLLGCWLPSLVVPTLKFGPPDHRPARFIKFYVALPPPLQPQVLGGGAVGSSGAPPAGDAGGEAKGGGSTLNGGREAAATEGATDAAGGSSAEEGRPAFVISDYTPEWDYTAGGAKVMITGEPGWACGLVWWGGVGG